MSPSARPSRRAGLVGAILALAAVAGGAALARRAPRTPPRAGPASILLDEVLDLTAGPVDRRILVAAPCRLEVEVTATTSVAATVGPPGPATPSGLGGPDEARATRFGTTRDGVVAGSLLVFDAGSYVVRVARTTPETVVGGPVRARLVVRRGPAPP